MLIYGVKDAARFTGETVSRALQEGILQELAGTCLFVQSCVYVHSSKFNKTFIFLLNLFFAFCCLPALCRTSDFAHFRYLLIYYIIVLSPSSFQHFYLGKLPI